jgi:hypothetical protein
LTAALARLWRAFPWSPDAPAGQPFSSSYRPAQSGAGRFDLPRATHASAWYLAESPGHAIGERLQDLRNRTLEPEDLEAAGHRLAVCEATVAVDAASGVVDLCDPAELVRYGIQPDWLAYRDRRVTQEISARLHRSGHSGLRWWSALAGEWHTVVLFTDRLNESGLAFETPRLVSLDDEALRSACDTLGIWISR